jgi:hypothetical protein
MAQHGRRPDDRVVGAGKTKDAVGARSVIGGIGREGRGAFAAMQAQFEARNGLAGLGGERKPAERYEKALRSNGISDDDPDQGSPKSLGPSPKCAHVHAYTG